MHDLRKQLDLILEDEPSDKGHPLDNAMDVVHQLRDAQQLVADLQHKLNSIKHRMSADLALALRRTKPGLNVAVDKFSCKVGYKTKHLQFLPEVEQGVWRVISPNRRFVREFLKSHNRATLLDSDSSILISAINDYFTNYYRTLGEDVVGTGILLVDERRASLLELAAWRNTNIINTRLARRQLAGDY